ncbi:MAG: hypothetical protein QME50_02630 [Candidatus Bathyarchaeota archaeon]|nr:hypothetical protein [Candidatus Bathyarchaeota archaeon]MDI6805417.1 hypothetical protein [Candidatus Bathyarchaeia archaeon]
MSIAYGYILRIATAEWVNQVFEMAIYYTGFRRKWKVGQTILFVHKTVFGDAFVGYGEIGNVYGLDELSEEERRECEKWRWKKAIEFKYIIRFEKPLPIKETFLKDLKIRGRTLHGYPLSKEQLNSIISDAERLQHETS